MTTINLYQQSAEESQLKNRDKINLLSGGFIYSVAVLLLVFVMYGGMKVYNSSLDKRNAALTEQLTQKRASFSGQDVVDQVADMQSRLDTISKNIATQTMMTAQLHSLATSMVSGVAVSSYKQVGSEITVDFLATNFTDISRQILNLKQSKDFTNVVVTSLNRGETNLAFEVTMDIANTPSASTQTTGTN